jgi:hypothetical protein
MRFAGATNLMLAPLTSVTTISPRAGRQAKAQSAATPSRFVAPQHRRIASADFFSASAVTARVSARSKRSMG